MLRSLDFSGNEKSFESRQALAGVGGWGEQCSHPEMKREGSLWTRRPNNTVLVIIPSYFCRSSHRDWVWECFCFFFQQEKAVLRAKRNHGRPRACPKQRVLVSSATQWEEEHNTRLGYVEINTTLVVPWLLRMKMLIIHSCDRLQFFHFMSLTHPWRIMSSMKMSMYVYECFYYVVASLEDILQLMGNVFPWSTCEPYLWTPLGVKPTQTLLLNSTWLSTYYPTEFLCVFLL